MAPTDVNAATMVVQVWERREHLALQGFFLELEKLMDKYAGRIERIRRGQ